MGTWSEQSSKVSTVLEDLKVQVSKIKNIAIAIQTLSTMNSGPLGEKIKLHNDTTIDICVDIMQAIDNTKTQISNNANHCETYFTSIVEKTFDNGKCSVHGAKPKYELIKKTINGSGDTISITIKKTKVDVYNKLESGYEIQDARWGSTVTKKYTISGSDLVSGDNSINYSKYKF